jgi:hypothetical protein
MSQIFAWFPLISQRLVPRRCQLPPQGEAMAPSAPENGTTHVGWGHDPTDPVIRGAALDGFVCCHMALI